MLYDHVGVHSGGSGKNNSALSWAELASPVVWDLADGQHHLVKVSKRSTTLRETLFDSIGRPVKLESWISRPQCLLFAERSDKLLDPMFAA